MYNVYFTPCQEKRKPTAVLFERCNLGKEVNIGRA
jgi:hypothetical protein